MYALGSAVAVASFLATRHKILGQHARSSAVKRAADVPGDCAEPDAPAGWTYKDGQLWYSNGTRQCAWDGVTRATPKTSATTASQTEASAPAADAPVPPPR